MQRKVLYLALFLAIPLSIEAGIVVMKNGNVFIARIREAEQSDEFVTLRWPYKGNESPRRKGIKKGAWKVERRLVRWVDAKNDKLTGKYFEIHANDKLDPRFEPQRQIWKKRKEGEKNLDTGIIDKLINLRRGPGIAPISIVKVHYEIRKPDKWLTKDVPVDRDNKNSNTVFTIVSPEAKNGFAARIHITSVARPKISVTEQRDWYDEEIRKLSGNGVLEVLQSPKVEEQGKRSNVYTVTVTRRGESRIVAQRYVMFRQDRVYFVSCYAEEEEYDRLSNLFKNCVKSMVIYEDERRQ